MFNFSLKFCVLQYHESPLWAASSHGYVDVVKTLIRAKGDVNHEDVVSNDCFYGNCFYDR